MRFDYATIISVFEQEHWEETLEYVCRLHQLQMNIMQGRWAGLSVYIFSKTDKSSRATCFQECQQVRGNLFSAS